MQVGSTIFLHLANKINKPDWKINCGGRNGRTGVFETTSAGAKKKYCYFYFIFFKWKRPTQVELPVFTRRALQFEKGAHLSVTAVIAFDFCF